MFVAVIIIIWRRTGVWIKVVIIIRIRVWILWLFNCKIWRDGLPLVENYIRFYFHGFASGVDI